MNQENVFVDALTPPEDSFPEINSKLLEQFNTKFRENLPLGGTDPHLESKELKEVFPQRANNPKYSLKVDSVSFRNRRKTIKSSFNKEMMRSHPEISDQSEFKNEKRNDPLYFHENFHSDQKHFHSEQKQSSKISQIISKFYLSKKFVDILLNLTSLRKPKWLSPYQYELINDQSYFLVRKNKQKDPEINVIKQKKWKFEGSKIDIIRKRILRSFSVYKKYMHVYDPTKNFSILWDVILLLFTTFFFVMIPLELVFGYCQGFKAFSYKKYGIFFILLDSLKSLNTAHYSKGVLVTNRKSIILNYCHTKLIIDLLSIIPFLIDYGEFPEDWEILDLFFYIRYPHFAKISERLEDLLFLSENLVSLVKLVLRILIFSHFFSCFWYYIGTLTSDSWIAKAGMAQDQCLTLYAKAFYFIIVTMNTVGFGDIVPANNYETFFVIFFILVGCGMFALNINQIGMILTNISKKSKEFKREMRIINHFMLDKNITFELKMKVRKYLQYIWNEEKIEELEEQWKIINKLSDSLKEELLLEANGPFIRDIKLFNLNFSEEVLRNTVNIMIERKFTPGDLIYSENDIENQSLFIIQKGEIGLFHNHFYPMKKLHTGEIFGEISFFSDKEREFEARSLDFSNVFEIKRADFLRILQRSKTDLETFNEIKDNINLYHDYSHLYIKCFSCQGTSHRISQCPVLHFIPKKDVVILRHNYFVDQSRQDWTRKERKKINSLSMVERLTKEASLYERNHFFFERDNTSEFPDQQPLENQEGSYLEGPLVDKSARIRPEDEENSCNFHDLKKNTLEELESPTLHNNSSGEKKKQLTLQTTSVNEPNPEKNDLSSLHILGKIQNEKFVEFDKLKSYEAYFRQSNIEVVLTTLERIKKIGKASNRNLLKKPSNSKSSLHHEPKIKVLSGDLHSNFYDKSKDSPFQKKFFKSINHLEKMIQEEKFDAEKFKQNVRKKLQIEDNEKKKNTSKLSKMIEFLKASTPKKNRFVLKNKQLSQKTLEKN